MVPALPNRWPVPYLAVVAGLLLLANPLYLAGPHLGDDVYRYEAHAVEYDGDDGLVTTSVATGERSDFVSIDEAIICDDHSISRECAFEYAVFSGDVNVSVAPVGAENYRFVYLDGAFYRPTYEGTLGERSAATHERVPAHEAFRAVSTRVDDASPVLQSVVREGERTTFRELDGAGELLRTPRSYYVVHLDAVERARLVASLPNLAGVVVGAFLCWSGLATLRSGRRLRELAREEDR